MGLPFDNNALSEIAKKIELQRETTFNKIKRFVGENPLANQVKNNRFFQVIN